jgi:hypothetical protein
MASTYSPNLAIELIGNGEQAGTWGTTTNTNLGTLLEQAISGYASQTITDGADTVITIPNGASGVARNMAIVCTGTLTAARNLVVPANTKLYLITNSTTGGYAVTVKVSGQTGVSVPNGAKMWLVSNGTDIVSAVNYIASLTVGSLSLSSPLSVAQGGTNASTAAGARTSLGAAASGANSDITSLTGLTTALSVAQGGTGDATLTANALLVGNGTGAIQALAPGAAGTAPVSDGTQWVATPISGGQIVGKYRNLQLSANPVITQLATTGASGTGTAATISFATQTAAPYAVNSYVTVAGVTPSGYNGTYQVTACTTSSVTFNNTTTGSQTVAGTVTTTQNAKVSISYDELALENGSNSYVTVRSGTLTADSSTSGANGLDTGSLSASTWYSVWVIYNPTSATVASLVSASSTSPTLPSGYTYYARVGWIRTDGTTNKYPLSFRQIDRNVQYCVQTAGNVPNMPIMASGASPGADISTPLWAALSVSSYVPPTANTIKTVIKDYTGNVLMVAPNNNYGSYTSTSNPTFAWVSGNGNYTVNMLLESTNVYWASNAGGLFTCSGWEDTL